ncbi:MAG TPA: PEGA domain-containing protein [Planctomycetota bacterium]|nr:PEGA domain-containing protein [Planctomycetota bacterium]
MPRLPVRASRFPLIGLVGLCVSVASVGSSLLASERFDPIEVATLPAGATVIVDGKVGGTTPLVVNLSRQLVHTIRVELAGYLPRAAEVRPEVDWKELSKNAFGGTLGGIVGGVIDLSSGKAKKLEPNDLQWTLDRVGEVEDALIPAVAGGLSGT